MRDLECHNSNNHQVQTKVKYRDYRDFLDNYNQHPRTKDDQESVSSVDSGISGGSSAIDQQNHKNYTLAECKSNSTSGSSLNGEGAKFDAAATPYRQFLENYSKKKFSPVRPSCVEQGKPTLRSEIFIQINEPQFGGKIDPKANGFGSEAQKDESDSKMAPPPPPPPLFAKINATKRDSEKIDHPKTNGFGSSLQKELAERYERQQNESRKAPPPPPLPIIGTNPTAKKDHDKLDRRANGFGSSLQKELAARCAKQQNDSRTAPPPPSLPIKPTNPTLKKDHDKIDPKANGFGSTTQTISKTAPTPPAPPPLPENKTLTNDANGNNFPRKIKVQSRQTAKTTGEVDKNDPNVKKLVYNTYREMLGAYNNKANDFVSTLPRNMVRQDKGIARQLESIMLQGGLERLNGRVNPNVENEN